MFMAVAINSSWKLPFAHFFTSSVSDEVQANLLTLAISNDTGAVVTNITCDKSASILNTIRILGGKVQNLWTTEYIFYCKRATYLSRLPKY